MYEEEELLPIAALQHLVFCPRQCALMYIEQTWAENRLTAEGKILHERVDTVDTDVRGDVRIARGLRLRSLRLGLTGKADVVEFHRIHPSAGGDGALGPSPPTPLPQSQGCSLPNAPGLWQPFPVEYKHGEPKPDRCDEVQICAQALCLEEMLKVSIPAGALFYGKPRRRFDVRFDEPLRTLTESLAVKLHDLIQSGLTPRARYEKKCRSCSLVLVCLPKATSGPRSVRDYLSRAVADQSVERKP